MSDRNTTDNPYQPPALSDEPKARQQFTATRLAKPHPINLWVPWFGYGYVPLAIGLIILSPDDLGTRIKVLLFFVQALCFLLPVYVLLIAGLTVQRIKQRTNSVGITLFQILSTVLPILVVLLAFS